MVTDNPSQLLMQLTSPPSSGSVILELITYNRQNYERYVATDVSDLVARIKPDQVNWVNLDGLGYPDGTVAFSKRLFQS